MKAAAILVCLVASTSLAMPVLAQPSDTATVGEENFEGSVSEEVEVTFAEEMDPTEFDATPMIPEYDDRPWLSVLPVLCALVIAWNVRWKAGARRHDRKKKKKA